MSKRSERREAERLSRKKAYQQLRQQQAQTSQPAAVAQSPDPALQNPEDLLARAQAFFQSASRAQKAHSRDAEQMTNPSPQAASADPSCACSPEAPGAISEAQLNANRANAQHSTGPTSQAGREISCRNNFRHGLTQSEGELILLESESPEHYNRTLNAFQDEWQPATATERDLVERLASRQWLRHRAMKLQNRFLAPDGLIIDEKQFALYRRYEVQHERAYNKALSDLMRLRSLRIREQNGFESQRRKEELHAFKMQALKDRETRNQFAFLEAEARFSLAQMRLSKQRVADILTEITATGTQTGEQTAEAHQ